MSTAGENGGDMDASAGSVVKDDSVASVVQKPHEHQRKEHENDGAEKDRQDNLTPAHESAAGEVNPCDEGTTDPDHGGGGGEQSSNTPQYQDASHATNDSRKENSTTDPGPGVGTPQSPQHHRSPCGPRPMEDAASPGCRSHSSLKSFIWSKGYFLFILVR